MRLLASIAHPDYTELFFGGTVIKHARKGDEVFIVSVSPGEMGDVPGKLTPKKLAEIRTRELQEAAKIEGVKEVRILNFKDTEIFNTPGLRMAIAEIIRELKPDIVITHWPNDNASDLGNTGQATIDACLVAYLGQIKMSHPPHMVGKIYTFEVPSTSVKFEPDIFIDITDVMETKIKAAKCHKSMIEAFAAGSVEAWISGIRGSNRYWGMKSKAIYAEAFKEVNVPFAGRKAIRYLPM